MPVTTTSMQLRAARPGDLRGMGRLIDLYAEQELLLPRTAGDLLRHLDQFVVAEEGGQVLALGSLLPMGPGLAEVRTLAVDPAAQGRGLGRQIVAALVAKGLEVGYPRIFCLTREPEFFASCGFEEVSVDLFPQKVWKDCRKCPRRDRCDEIAMQYAGARP